MTERDVFIAALQKENPAERRAYLDETCAGHPELRQQVEQLLRLHEGAGSFLEKPAAEAVATGVFQDVAEKASSPEAPGALIGPYKLLEPIGEGGMGTVWMAQQTQPVKRLVAVKLIKAGMDSRQVIARFEAERQALALMDHANIARVLDAGTTKGEPGGVSPGRPYFVMDLVRGVPITRYCDEHHLTPRQRLELFIPVCQAVQHAHQKGIIHRDLKPSNVMVTLSDGKPVPKVIDFGVAKATGQQLTEKTLVTGFGALVGTLEYMSPEQAEINQLDIDTRSDIYSLGVLLYELLTGSPPFSRKELEKAGILEMLRVIREQEPSKPSTKLSTAEGLPTLAANRGTEPAKLTRLVRGELDWIVMKALDKDRNRRYETANGLAMDVQRYLADEPVLACPPSAGYRLRKFARRNKGGLAVAALVLSFLVLLGSGIGWTVRDRAARQGRIGAEVDLILAEVDRLEGDQKWPEALAAARRAEAAVSGGDADPATAQRVRTLVKDLEFVDRLEQIDLETATLVEGKLDAAGADRKYARVFREYGVDVDALAVETSIDRLKVRMALAIPLAAALDNWMHLRQQISARDGADWRRLVAVARGIDPEPLRDRLRSLWGRPVSEVRDEMRRLADSIDVQRQPPVTLLFLAGHLRSVKHSDSAIRILRDAQYVYPGDFWLKSDLGSALNERKDYEGAIRFYTAAVSIRPNSAAAHGNLGAALRNHKKPVEAIAAFNKAIELDPDLAHPQCHLGYALLDQKKLPEAIAAFNKAIELDPDFARAYAGLGAALCHQKKLPEAIAACEKAIALDQGFAHPHCHLGYALLHQKKLPEAIAAFNKAIKLDPQFTGAYSNLGAALLDQKKLPEAIAACQKAIKIDPQHTDAYCNLGAALTAQKKLPEAIAACQKAIEIDPNHAHAYGGLGSALYQQKKLPESIAASRKAIEIDPTNVAFHYNLGRALYDQQRLPEAMAAFNNAIKIDANCALAHHLLSFVLRQQKKLDEAIAACRRAVALDKEKADSQATLADLLNERAWQLVSGDPKSHDPKRALELTQEAAALLPKITAYQQTLGVAHYRAGNWKAAVLALQKIREIDPHFQSDSLVLFYLSMAYGRLEKKDQAGKLYDQAAQWRMGIFSTEEELRRLCAEAAILLGREVPPTLKESPVLATGPTMVKPAAGATLDNGTPDGRKAAVWEFDWSDVPGATRYHLYVYLAGATVKFPVINNPSLTESSFRTGVGHFADHCRRGWRWKVRALVKGVWSDWSEERTFEVAPLDDSKPASPRK